MGTFGIASASYYWSRVAAAVGRFVQYLSGYTSTSWHMLVADDYLLESGGPEYRVGLLLFFVLCAVVGVPLSWHKTCGGDTLVWVGFELLLRSRCVGISARRAEWFIKWADSVASSSTIHMGTFEEGLVGSCSLLVRLSMNDLFSSSLQISHDASQELHSPCTAVRVFHIEVFGSRSITEETLRLRYEDLPGWMYSQSRCPSKRYSHRHRWMVSRA